MAMMMCGAAQEICAQPWALEQQVVVGVFDSSEIRHVQTAIWSDFLAVSVCSENGGHVELRHRHHGGFDQWGSFATYASTEPWFGYSLALDSAILAVGAPGALVYTGTVHLYAFDALDLFQPVIDRGTISSSVLLPGDRFGYSLILVGDTLMAGAVGTVGFRTNGAVFQFIIGSDTVTAAGQLPNDPDRAQVPFQRWFGAAIAQAGNRLAVAAPHSGFQENEPRQNIGTLHIYSRSTQSPSGWALDTVLFDPTPRINPCLFFEHVELGREGMAFVGDGIVVGHSDHYDGESGDALSPWRSHVGDTTGCDECSLRLVSNDPAGWGLEGADSPLVPDARSFQGWCGQGDRLFVNQIDALHVWRTTEYGYDQISGQWTAGLALPELDACDMLDGPLVYRDGSLVRASLRRDIGCGVPSGSVRLDLQIFRE